MMHIKEFKSGFSGYSEHGQLLYDVTGGYTYGGLRRNRSSC